VFVSVTSANHVVVFLYQIKFQFMIQLAFYRSSLPLLSSCNQGMSIIFHLSVPHYFCNFIFLKTNLIKIRCLLYLFFNNFSLAITCKTVEYIDQSNNSFWCIVSFDTYRFSRLITDWAVENMNSDMTPYRISFNISVNILSSIWLGCKYFITCIPKKCWIYIYWN
jgi:hypothetical protein